MTPKGGGVCGRIAPALRSRGGFTLAEATVALLLAGVLTACLACVLMVIGRLAARHSRVATASETERVVAAVLDGELRTLTAADATFDSDSVRLRVFRGMGTVCGFGAEELVVRYRGVRAPEPEKDSVLLLWSDGEAAFDLESAASASCAVEGDVAVGLSVGWRTTGQTTPPAIALVFETGAYSLGGGAFRYRRGAGGRQPLTDANLSDAHSSLTETALPDALASAAVIRLLPRDSPGAQPLAWRLLMPQRRARPTAPRNRRRRAARRTGGFALITVVLLMIGLAVLATGLVFAASQQATLVASTHDVLRARYAAEAAVVVATKDWVAAERSLDASGALIDLFPSAELEPGVRMSAQSERVAGDLFLVKGTGSVSRGDAPPIRQRAARLVRSIDAHSVGLGLDAAVIASHVRVSGDGMLRGDAAGAAAVHASAADLCAGWPAGGAAVRAPPDSVVIAAGATASGDPPLVPDVEVSRYLAGVGFLATASLADAALRIDDPVVTPSAVVVGEECLTSAPGNLGAPSGPCAAHWPLVHAPADLTLDGGYAQGVLIADGDLVLTGAVHVRGLLLVRGTLVLRDATVEGAVVAARVRVDRGSASLDRCAVADALAAAPPLRAPHPPLRSWLPAFD